MKQLFMILAVAIVALPAFAEVYPGETTIGCSNSRGQGFTLYINYHNSGKVRFVGNEISYLTLAGEDKDGYTFVADRNFVVLDDELVTHRANGLKISKKLAENAIVLSQTGTVVALKSLDPIATYNCRGGSEHR